MLIDIKASRITKIDKFDTIRYATLSYVWGNPSGICKIPDQSLDWKRDEDGKETHPLPNPLPRTLLDALIVTAALDLQYLWVDSLCVDQNNILVRVAQVGEICDIYLDAELCIVAASGINSDAGIPGISSPRSAPDHSEIPIREGVSVGTPLTSLSDLLKQGR